MIGALVAGITGAGGASLSSYESIATATGTGSSGTITFSSIPSTFKHLQIRGIAQAVGSGTSGACNLTLNPDSGTNYAWHYLNGDGATAAAAGNATIANIYVGRPVRNTSYPDTLGVMVIDILDYGSTTKNKTIRSFSGFDLNGSGQVIVHSGVWMSTSAVTSISLIDPSFNFSTKSTIALYGIKEA